MKEEGFDIGKSVSPIFHIMIRDNKKVYEIAKMLQEKGIFTIRIVYPAVRTKEARLDVYKRQKEYIQKFDKGKRRKENPIVKRFGQRKAYLVAKLKRSTDRCV